LGTWLTERFTLLGATFQNWMLVAVAIVLVGVLIAWWRQR
jgi:drug/metabolite transporter (DMT)-like permease